MTRDEYEAAALRPEADIEAARVAGIRARPYPLRSALRRSPRAAGGLAGAAGQGAEVTTPNTDLAALAERQADLARQALARDAMRLAAAAREFAANIIRGGPQAGRASGLAQDALQVALAATKLDALAEQAELLKETT